jgi:2-methylcitrate dehydratase
MENILFKISFPAEFHAQTCVEACMALHPLVKDRIDDIDRIVIETQEAGVRIIDKTGPLDNPADRDHCIQYMAAVPLLFGRLTAADYEDGIAADPRIDALRAKMDVHENERFTNDYFDPDKRYIGNAVQVFFDDGTSTERVAVDVPVGHRERRDEGIPLLLEKFVDSVSPKLAGRQWGALEALAGDREKLAATPVDDFMALLVA